MVPLKQHPRFAGISDADLRLLYLRDRNSLALECLLSRYNGLIIRSVSRFPKLRQDRDDIVCMCFVTIDQKLPSYDSGLGDFGPWVRRVVVNLCIDEYRRKHSRRYSPSLTALALEDIVPVNVPERADGPLHYAEFRTHVEKFLAGLRSRTAATIMEMKFFDGFTLQEISKTLSMGLESVKGLYYYNLKRLQAHVGIYLGKPGFLLAFFFKVGYSGATMASQENLVKMIHKATGHVYMTRKNRKKLASVKLKLRKYNPVLRKVVEYTEGKK